MTREEKEQTGKYVLKMARLLEDRCWQQKMLLNAVHIIDEVLEQEDVLDKIRSEIEQDAFKDVNGSKYIFVNRVNQILDKYKGEVRKRNEF